MTGIFLHTSWRSAGTWAWEALRTRPDTIGFYEPLHEALATLTRASIEERHAGAWESRHPPQKKPYFAEYEPLLRIGGFGVNGAGNRFAFDRYVMEESDEDPGLRRYLQSLCDMAARLGRRPVFKCVRSQGRLLWLQRAFPAYRHIAVVRHPYAQFTSAWHCLSLNNPYFVATPLLVLERNATHPAVSALIEALDLPIEAPAFATAGWRMRRWIRRAPSVPLETLYRATFALWLLNARQALGAAELYDGDEPAALAGALGIPPGARPPPVTDRPPIPAAALRKIHEAGFDAVEHWLGSAAGAVPAWLARAEEAAASTRRAAGEAYRVPAVARAVRPHFATGSMNNIFASAAARAK